MHYIKNADEQTRLTDAVRKVTEIGKSMAQARRDFVAELRDAVKEAGVIRSENQFDTPIVETLEESTIKFKQMEWNEASGEVIVTATTLRNTEVRVQLKDILNPEMLFPAL